MSPDKTVAFFFLTLVVSCSIPDLSNYADTVNLKVVNKTVDEQQVWFYAGKYDSLKLSVDGGDSLRYDWKPNLSNGEGGLGIRHEVFANGCGAYFTNGSLTTAYLGFTLTFYNDSLSCETRIEQPR